jgi:hypothetical protein
MGKAGSDFFFGNSGIAFVMPSPAIKQRPYIVRSSGLQIENIIKIKFYICYSLKYECVFAVASIWNLMTNRLRRLIQEIQ